MHSPSVGCYMKDMAEINKKVREGLGSGDVVLLLHGLGFSITESIRFLVEEYGCTLADAKRFVSESPVWKPVVDASIPLHREIVECLGKGKV
ncbi:hypothetical protein [Pseudomonas sp. FeS53a]|uniref:hypothetical protein n=1 Tax=Pseudomonas sp. FeS53a TaxID=1604022 RepID=UPI00128B5A21|nr:hypothetical protein [Pseudomonas sp. FeS53a]